MDFTKLKKEIKEISDLASLVPEALREKCFEILLRQLLEEEGATDRHAAFSTATMAPIQVKLRSKILT